MSTAKKIIISALFFVLLVAGVIVLANPMAWWFQPTNEAEPAATTTSDISAEDNNLSESSTSTSDKVPESSEPSLSVIADNLSVPWGVDFLPGGNLLVTERTGALLEIDPEGGVVTSLDISSATPQGEGGLLGVAVHPNFSENGWIYLYETTADSGALQNRVARFHYEDGSLSNRTTILDGIDGARYHDGGRIDFGPDGYLYITTGDAGNPEIAQSTSTLEGKILRVTDAGDIPGDNPFGNEVYSYGHRNPQGIAWNEVGQLFSTEHGRSGVRSGLDEANLIKAGSNYGWPYLEGDEDCSQDNLYSPSLPADQSGEACQAISPMQHSGPDITWAPASATIVNDSVFFGGLRGQALYEAPIITSGTEIQLGEVRTHFKNEFGRIRTVVVSPDGQALYVTTSNTDGRGQPEESDDKLLRISLSIF